MTRVTEETEDDSWVDSFRVAYEHHLNFYNDDMTAQDIEDDRLIVNSFVGSAADSYMGQRPIAQH